MTSIANAGRLQSQVVQRRVTVRHPRGLRTIQILPPCLLFLALLLQLGIRVMLIERAYRLETLRQQALAKDVELRTLRADVALVTRPKDLAQQAGSRLGLIQLSPERVRRIEMRREGQR